MRSLHLVDNAHVQTNKEHPDYDRMAKARNLIEMQNDLYNKFWKPERYLTINEMMIPYKGRYSPGMRQYMAKNPTKYGIKSLVSL